MESLRENKPLLYSLMISGGAIIGLTSGMLPDIAQQFEIVEFPSEVSTRLEQEILSISVRQ